MRFDVVVPSCLLLRLAVKQQDGQRSMQSIIYFQFHSIRVKYVPSVLYCVEYWTEAAPTLLIQFRYSSSPPFPCLCSDIGVVFLFRPHRRRTQEK